MIRSRACRGGGGPSCGRQRLQSLQAAAASGTAEHVRRSKQLRPSRSGPSARPHPARYARGANCYRLPRLRARRHDTHDVLARIPSRLLHDDTRVSPLRNPRRTRASVSAAHLRHARGKAAKATGDASPFLLAANHAPTVSAETTPPHGGTPHARGPARGNDGRDGRCCCNCNVTCAGRPMHDASPVRLAVVPC